MNFSIATISYGCTRPDGNHQSIRVDATARVPEVKDPTEVLNELRDYVEDQANRFSSEPNQVVELRRQRGNLSVEIGQLEIKLATLKDLFLEAKRNYDKLKLFADKNGVDLDAFPIPDNFFMPEKSADELSAEEQEGQTDELDDDDDDDNPY